MSKKCPKCLLVNSCTIGRCVRCQSDLVEVSSAPTGGSTKLYLLRRATICLIICLISIFGFYFSMILTSKPLTYDQKRSIGQSIEILDQQGFAKEVFLLRYLTSFRSNDNWLNASTITESAYAATNYPFEIMTIYPDFFEYSKDDIERAAILLHEAQHLQGKDEKEAYSFVWKNRKQLGWTSETHGDSLVWRSVRKQTREYAPELFICEFNEFDDCTS